MSSFTLSGKKRQRSALEEGEGSAATGTTKLSGPSSKKAKTAASSNDAESSGAFDHDLSGAVAASVKLAETSESASPRFADVLLKPSPSAKDQLRVYSFGKTLSDADLKVIFKKTLAGGSLTVLKREKLPVEEETGLQMVCHSVRFPSAAAAETACEQLSCAYPSVDGDSSALGLKGMLSALGTQKQDPRELQRAVDVFMAEFDKAEGKAAEAKAQVTKAMDSDGFTLVTSKGGFTPAAASSSSAAEKKKEDHYDSANQAKKKKRGTLIKDDFYKFQKQESKLDREWIISFSFWACLRCRSLSFSFSSRPFSLSVFTFLQASPSCEQSSKRTGAGSRSSRRPGLSSRTEGA